MDYEKLYKEALGRAKDNYNAADSANINVNSFKNTLISIFPELRESEDKKIRDEILAYVGSKQDIDLNTHNRWCSWLEKQGANSATITNGNTSVTSKEVVSHPTTSTTIEPKFHEGEWVVQGYNILKIKCVGDTYYCFETVGGYVDNMLVSEVDSQFHLWTIKDAKDGDVLASKIDGDVYILIYKQIKDGWIETYGHYYVAVDRFCVPSQLFCRDCKGTFYPATKEQRDLLFQKIREEGYEWNDEKKELKKSQRIVSAKAKEALYDNVEDFEEELTNIIFTNTATSELPVKRLMELCHIIYKDVLEAARKEIEKNPTNSGKPAWSEEDDSHVRGILSVLQIARGKAFVEQYKDSINSDIDWLESLKQRIR